MNIELEEVVELDVSDDALELAAGGAQGGTHTFLERAALVMGVSHC